jgi:hypothetical protein
MTAAAPPGADPLATNTVYRTGHRPGPDPNPTPLLRDCHE